MRMQKNLLTMARSVVKLEREGSLNHLIKNKKNKDFVILYHSLWDEYSERILGEIDMWKDRSDKKDEVVHLINSWDLPHSFVAFSVTSVPTLVRSVRGRILVENYLPNIFRFFSS